MIYTTWQKKYTHLEPFAEYSWNHAPYIYHYPIKSSPSGKLMFPVIISGNEWDKSWTLNGSSLYYRTNINDEFTRQEFQAVPLFLQGENTAKSSRAKRPQGKGCSDGLPEKAMKEMILSGRRASLFQEEV